MPFNTNINWVVLFGSLCSLLALFGFNVPDNIRADIVTCITAGSAVVVWALHTFVNHPANVKAANAMAQSAFSAAKVGSPLPQSK